MMEIQALQTRQKEEIESLFTRMGKPPPPSVFSPAVAMAGGRRRRKSHRSSRNSGQPSPIHSGTDSELHFLIATADELDNILTVPLVSGSPGLSQSLHALDCCTEQSLPSAAAEASDVAAEAAQLANSSSVTKFRSSPSMPSLSNCATGPVTLCAVTVVCLSLATILLTSVVFQDWVRPASQMVQVIPRTILSPWHRQQCPPP